MTFLTIDKHPFAAPASSPPSDTLARKSRHSHVLRVPSELRSADCRTTPATGGPEQHRIQDNADSTPKRDTI